MAGAVLQPRRPYPCLSLVIEDFAPQLIWLAIIFAAFYFALAYRALPRIQEVLATRKAKIEGDLESARAAQRRADSESERYEAGIAAAKAKGQSSIRTHSREA